MNIIPGMDIGRHAISNAQGQSFLCTSTSQLSHYSSFYWHLSDPLVDLLGSIHENMSETGGAQNNFVLAASSFNFTEHERVNGHVGEDVSVQQIREAHPVDEGNNGDGLQASLLSQAATAEGYDTNAPFTSEGSSSNLRRHGTTGLVQDFMASLDDHVIEEEEEEEEIHEAALLSHRPTLHDVESTRRHLSSQHIVQLSEPANIRPKWRVLLEPGVRHALCHGMLILLDMRYCRDRYCVL
uniref:Uncharacterized protein n=1 Tax=Hordeum vulgare subsp. vulgare TaxID=112509 RepID=A0A8I6XNX7_HORVV